MIEEPAETLLKGAAKCFPSNGNRGNIILNLSLYQETAEGTLSLDGTCAS